MKYHLGGIAGSRAKRCDCPRGPPRRAFRGSGLSRPGDRSVETYYDLLFPGASASTGGIPFFISRALWVPGLGSMNINIHGLEGGTPQVIIRRSVRVEVSRVRGFRIENDVG